VSLQADLVQYVGKESIVGFRYGTYPCLPPNAVGQTEAVVRWLSLRRFTTSISNSAGFTEQVQQWEELQTKVTELQEKYPLLGEVVFTSDDIATPLLTLAYAASSFFLFAPKCPLSRWWLSTLASAHLNGGIRAVQHQRLTVVRVPYDSFSGYELAPPKSGERRQVGHLHLHRPVRGGGGAGNHGSIFVGADPPGHHHQRGVGVGHLRLARLADRGRGGSRVRELSHPVSIFRPLLVFRMALVCRPASLSRT
jgi:hypothetical protein